MRLSEEQMIDRAATLAARAHENQVRKDGTPYIAHPVRVAIRVEGKLLGTIALLHDTVEDTAYTLDDLRDAGFTEEVIAAVDALTRRPGESYKDFIMRCSRNELAVSVKLADIEDNLSDQSALDPEEAEFLTKRYTAAKEVLNG
jgi:(p)ppGpp synthase/HD superfamily hydrolase